MAAILKQHITIDERGVARLSGTTTKVLEVVLAKLGEERTPEELHADFPHWSLAQIHAALAFYYDNKEELDARIEADEREYEQLRAASQQPTREEWEDRFRRRREAKTPAASERIRVAA